MPEPTNQPPATDRLARLSLAWAASLLALLAATWPLWTPWRETPRLAIMPFLAGTPPAVDFAALGLLGYSLIRFFAARSSLSTPLAIGALLLLLAPDQNRWQPWAYHAVLVGLLIACCSVRDTVRWARWLTISVYAYSAIAKLDATYAATLGQQVLGIVVGWLGISLEELPEGVAQGLALLIPLFELLLALLLALSLRFTSLSKPVSVAAIAMHAGTIGLLGPWALGHSTGVLVWNACFAWQTLVLFWPNRADLSSESSPPNGRAAILAKATVMVALVAPLTHSFGGWDRWPSWGLYAPAGERAAVYVHGGAADRLPESIQQHLQQAADGPWRRLRIDQWVLGENRAPIYPQNRVRLAMAAALAKRYALSDRVRVISEGHAGRFSGDRESTTLEGAKAVSDASRWWGLPPRVVWTD